MVSGVSRRVARLLLGAVLLSAALLCAASSASAAAQPRIIGGTNATAPYQVRVDSFLGECGGVIRDATHVITAGHCASETGVPLPAATLAVHYGSTDRTDNNPARTANVSSVTLPARYLAGDGTYDAALLTLTAPLNGFGSATVNSIPFAGSAAVNAAIAAGGSGFATGWGLTTEGGSQSQQLQGVSIPLRLDSACSAFFGASYSPERMVCAGGGSAPSGNPDTCSGDSGGPLALNVGGGALALAAITSFGQGCGEQNAPAAYTDVANFEICAVLGGGSACDPAPVVTPRAVPDTTRPKARVTKVRCRRRRCTFHVRTSDNSGHVKSLSMAVSRRVRSCHRVGGRRRCRTVTRTRSLHARRIAGGFSATAKLRVATYSLRAVARDQAGNRSKTARKTFRVKKA
jgi:trypsin